MSALPHVYVDIDAKPGPPDALVQCVVCERVMLLSWTERTRIVPDVRRCPHCGAESRVPSELRGT